MIHPKDHAGKTAPDWPDRSGDRWGIAAVVNRGADAVEGRKPREAAPAGIAYHCSIDRKNLRRQPGQAQHLWSTTMTQKITPSLWFDGDAEAATNFYVSAFRDGDLLDIFRWSEGGPGEPGSILTTRFRIADLEFMTINAGPEHKPTPALSFLVGCETVEELEALWAKLVEGGAVLMELGSYPFSERYGWLNDRFGVSWQLILTGAPQSISPCFMFVGDQFGRAEEAMTQYVSLFEDSAIGDISRYGAGDQAEAVMHASFTLAGQAFTAMDSNEAHAFTFTEGVSLSVDCGSQAEVDRFWDALTANGGEPGPCGWLKDRFGVSWQIVPSVMNELLGDPDPEKANRAMQAMMQMTKIDIAAMQRAHDGEAA